MPLPSLLPSSIVHRRCPTKSGLLRIFSLCTSVPTAVSSLTSALYSVSENVAQVFGTLGSTPGRSTDTEAVEVVLSWGLPKSLATISNCWKGKTKQMTISHEILINN